MMRMRDAPTGQAPICDIDTGTGLVEGLVPGTGLVSIEV